MNMLERIQSLGEAREKINDAIDLIRDALSGTKYSNFAERNIIAKLNMWANEYDEKHDTLPKIIDNIDILEGD